MPDERSLPEVAADIVREVKLLIKQHLALASAELSDAARSLAAKGVQLVIAIVLGLLGAGALLAAVVLGLVAWGVQAWVAALIVGVANVVVAGVMAWMAIGALKRLGFLPNTVAALKGHLEEGVS